MGREHIGGVQAAEIEPPHKVGKYLAQIVVLDISEGASTMWKSLTVLLTIFLFGCQLRTSPEDTIYFEDSVTDSSIEYSDLYSSLEKVDQLPLDASSCEVGLNLSLQSSEDYLGVRLVGFDNSADIDVYYITTDGIYHRRVLKKTEIPAEVIAETQFAEIDLVADTIEQVYVAQAPADRCFTASTSGSELTHRD